MALFVAEHHKEGVSSSDDSCDDNEKHIEGESTVCKYDDAKNSFPITTKENGFGIDLDLFGRFAPIKIPRKYGKPIYHYHQEPSIRDLKYIWNEIQCKELIVRHIDSEYSLMQFIGDEHHNTNYNLITRRCIWPNGFQNKFYETNTFKYNLSDINKYFKWCIILVMGGKFSIALYHGNECIYHKCARAYVVRGNRNGKREINFLSNKTKYNKGSAGSQQRAWNEMHLKENIQEILACVQDEIMNCNKIWIHAPSPANKLALFGEKREQEYLYPNNENLSRERLKQVRVQNTNQRVNRYRLSKKDKRIMSVPITVHKAIFSEVERVHYWLSTCWLSGANKQ